MVQISSDQSLSHVRLFATPWIAAHQASLSITNSRSSLRLMSIKSVMPSSHLILCCPLLLLPLIPPSIRDFPMSQLFTWGGQSTGVSASASFLPKKSQGWSSEWNGWISLQSKGLSRVFSNITVQKHQFFGAQPSSQSNSHIHTWPQEYHLYLSTVLKASGGDGIPVELFQILKDDAMKVLHSICQQIWKTQQWPQDWKRSVFIPIPKKGNAKACSNYHTIALISHASKVMLKILQASL